MAAPVLIFRERKNHVPTFCPWQNKTIEQMKEVTICCNGIPITDLKRKPITVDRIAPERRWAVMESGEILEQHRFHELFLAKWREWYRLAYNPPVKPPSKDSLEPVPAVTEYVRFEVDPKAPNNCRMIGYDPEEGKGRRPTQLFDRNGENARPYDEVILEQYDKDPSKLKKHEREYAEKLRGHSSGLDAVQLKAKLDVLVSLMSQGKLTAEEFAIQAAAISGANLISTKVDAPKSVEVNIESSKEEDSLSCDQCGRHIGTAQGVKLHKTRWCKAKKAS
jgi:hypothetical protein